MSVRGGTSAATSVIAIVVLVVLAVVSTDVSVLAVGIGISGALVPRGVTDVLAPLGAVVASVASRIRLDVAVSTATTVAGSPSAMVHRLESVSPGIRRATISVVATRYIYVRASQNAKVSPCVRARVATGRESLLFFFFSTRSKPATVGINKVLAGPCEAPYPLGTEEERETGRGKWIRPGLGFSGTSRR